MRLLKAIVHKKGMVTRGKTFCRAAVRAIIFSEGKLLMVYSSQNGDYKFPGGGVQPGETQTEALRREVMEECGARVARIEGAFGKVVEYDLPLEPAYEVFKMSSYYYICQIDQHLGRQRLDPYEADLGFRPGWVDVELALRTNLSLLGDAQRERPRWTEREAFVLEQVRDWLG